ncbi:MAG: DUF309 domain-containing protein [Terrimicrobiaceae bacterium]|nr:DUF309 domain-containing protein [Terrimicrobiaceae bacterium]
MRKTERIAGMVAEMGLRAGVGGCDARYLAYFECFNSGMYYEAHDVLEDLWLSAKGPDFAFYKGLIQLAGAFVHLRKQRENPAHPIHGRRLAPAARLLRLAAANIRPFAPLHHRLSVARVLRICEETMAALEQSSFSCNPWEPARAPRLVLEQPTPEGPACS